MSMTDEEFDAYTREQAHKVYCDPEEDKKRKKDIKEYKATCICNNCGKDFLVYSRGIDGEEFPVGYYGMFDMTYSGGYESDDLSDCLEYTFSLCESCLKDLFKGFKIPPRIRNYTNVRW